MSPLITLLLTKWSWATSIDLAAELLLFLVSLEYGGATKTQVNRCRSQLCLLPLHSIYSFHNRNERSIMTSTDTARKTEITLKGSVEIVSDFFFTAINSILYQRGAYCMHVATCDRHCHIDSEWLSLISCLFVYFVTYVRVGIYMPETFKRESKMLCICAWMFMNIAVIGKWPFEVEKGEWTQSGYVIYRHSCFKNLETQKERKPGEWRRTVWLGICQPHGTYSTSSTSTITSGYTT
jgi:hypothetical protein